jgi:hypothetical protein
MESALATELARWTSVSWSGKFENMHAVDIQQSLILLYEYGFKDFP